MCAAIEELRNDSRIEGRIEGTVTTCRRFNMPLQETIKYISEEYNISLQQAEEQTMTYWQ